MVAATFPSRVSVFREGESKTLHCFKNAAFFHCQCDWLNSREILVSRNNRKKFSFGIGDLVKGKFENGFESESFVNDFVISQELKVVLSGHADNKVRLFDLRSGEVCSSILAHKEEVVKVKLEEN